ncbi:MAG: hypothetical protein MHM6MM_005280 [Cercozoa sp. M6MM]
MQANEAIVVVGAERFSEYSGYGHSFKFAGAYCDTTPTAQILGAHVLDRTIIAVDALNLHRRRLDQWNLRSLERELTKATVGFSFDSGKNNQNTSVATGNWGCGAFGGDVVLKACLQWIACSLAGQSMQYFTFGCDEVQQFRRIVEVAMQCELRVFELWRILQLFEPSYGESFCDNVIRLARQQLAERSNASESGDSIASSGSNFGPNEDLDLEDEM